MNPRGRHIEAGDERTVAVLIPHLSANGAPWHAIVLRREGEVFSIVGERSARENEAAFAEWLRQFGPTRALVMLPASATICRTCPLPPAAHGEQLASALRLQAETALLGGIPSHRVAMTSLPGIPAVPGAAGASRQGLIIAWPESSTIHELPALPPTCEVRYVPLIASLLALTKGEAPPSPLIRVDRDEGTIVFVLGTTDGILVRATREEGDDHDRWREGVLRAAAETLLAADRSADEIRALHAELAPQSAASRDGSFLLVPGSVAASFVKHLPGGRTGDAAKDADRLLAVGAALTTAGPLAGLTTIRNSLPAPHRTPFERATAWIASPSNTLALVFIAALVFLFGPVLFAGLRYGILRLKVSDPDQVEAVNLQTRQRVQVYNTLEKEAWPMTKLLGDVANSLPEGIDIEMLQLAHGDGLTLKGTARPITANKSTAHDELWRLEQLMRNTKIFTNYQGKKEQEAQNGYVPFTVNFEVRNPTQVVNWGKDDYATTTLKDRRYPNWREIEKGTDATVIGGEETAAAPATDETTRTASKPEATPTPKDENALAKGTEEAPKTEEPDAKIATNDATNDEATEAANGAANAEAAGSGSGRGIDRANKLRPPGEKSGSGDKPVQPTSAPALDIPGPFTDEEIKALSKAEAQALLGKISRARQLPTLDEETKKRLKDDFNRVLQQAKVAS